MFAFAKNNTMVSNPHRDMNELDDQYVCDERGLYILLGRKTQKLKAATLYWILFHK